MRYDFADYALDAAHYELRHAGQLVRLEPRVFDLLAYLVQHPERIVTKEELLAQLWPNQFVAEDSLTNAVAQVRKALGDTGQRQHYIQTVRRRGYRFLPLVAVLQQSEPAPPTPPGAETPGPGAPQGHDPAAAAAPAAPGPPVLVPGLPLAPAMPPTQGLTGPGMPEAERRQLTVMVCDLVGSTALAEQLDPEDWRDVVWTSHAPCAAVIRRFAGSIAQDQGDRFLVYFGYPQAHEDDAQRAVRTGLGIIEAMGTLNAHLEHDKGIRMAVRVGIHTGLVVVGESGSSGRQAQWALGETPHIAARLQELAAPDTVVLSAATARLVEGYFVCQPLEAQALTGVSQPRQVWRVLQASAAQTRLDIIPPCGLTPLVGRDEEVALLHRRWEQATRGQGQVVLLSGEAGIGKSRLVQMLKDSVATAPHTCIEWRSSPYHQQSALYPVIDHLHRRLQWPQDDPPHEKLRTLEAMLALSGLALAEAVPLLVALLALPLPASYPPLTLTPYRQRQRTFDTLLAWLHADAQRQPVLLVVEDLHWLDPSTLELLSLIIDQSTQARLCLVLTARPEFHPPWALEAHLTTLMLRRLAPDHVARVATHVAGDKALPAEVVAQIVAKTDGVPLFVEELTKMVLGSGLLQEGKEDYELQGPLPPLAIPATLQDALLARLDRLAAAKGVAQLGATIGRTFAYDLLQAVAPLDAATLQGALAQLVEAEVVAPRGLPPQATYTFKHALIQDTAYQSLLKSTRQQYHQRIAQVLEEQFPETAAEQPALLARHYTEAGLQAQAVPYWHHAGQRAVERSANLEAISHFTKGLELLQALPDTLERVQQELTLQLAIGPPLLMLKGHTAPEVEHAYTRAYTLAQQLGETPQRFSVLAGLQRFYLSQARFPTARELAEQCFVLAQHLRRPASLQEAHLMLGSTFFFMGDPVVAHAHLEQGIALYDPQQSHTRTFSRGTDPGVECLARGAWALWWLGYPARALARSHEAIALAQQLAHPYSLVFALQYNAILHMWRRETALVKERAEAAMALMQEHGLVNFLGGAMVKLGWVLVEQGAVEEGVVQIRRALDIHRIHGVKIGLHENLALLAQAYGRAGQATEGLRVLAEVMAAVRNTRESYCQAELYRLKGELLLQSGIEETEEAAACFRQALDLARHQQAKSLELRAVRSVVHLWQRQGKQAEARQMLAEIYSWFTEGFDTLDLQETKALLEALE